MFYECKFTWMRLEIERNPPKPFPLGQNKRLRMAKKSLLLAGLAGEFHLASNGLEALLRLNSA